MITAEWLDERDACADQIALFRATFGAGAALTRENLARAAGAGLDVYWLAAAVVGADAWWDRWLPAMRDADAAWRRDYDAAVDADDDTRATPPSAPTGGRRPASWPASWRTRRRVNSRPFRVMKPRGAP